MAFTSPETHPIQITIYNADHPEFIGPAVHIERHRLKREDYRRTKTEIADEERRAVLDLYKNDAQRPIGALALVEGIPAAYAYTNERCLSLTEGLTGRPVCLRSVCVDPDFPNRGLSAIVAIEALKASNPRRRFEDCVHAASILLQHGFEPDAPDAGELRTRRFTGKPATSLEGPDPLPVDHPDNPTVGEIIAAIRQGFPDMPDYASAKFKPHES